MRQKYLSTLKNKVINTEYIFIINYKLTTHGMYTFGNTIYIMMALHAKFTDKIIN